MPDLISKNYLLLYIELEELIEKRQEYEALNDVAPYNLRPTTVDFKDIHGNKLIHYAAALGDIEKIKICLSRGSKSRSALKHAVENQQLAAAQYLFHHSSQRCDLIKLSECRGETRA